MCQEYGVATEKDVLRLKDNVARISERTGES